MNVFQKMATWMSQDVGMSTLPVDPYAAKLDAISEKSSGIDREVSRIEHDILKAEGSIRNTNDKLKAIARQWIALEKERDRLLKVKADSEETVAKLKPEHTRLQKKLEQYTKERQAIRREQQEERERQFKASIQAQANQGKEANAKQEELLAKWKQEMKEGCL